MLEPSALNQSPFREAETLLRMIEDISSELELRPLLSKILVYACDLLGADRGAIGLVDVSESFLRLEVLFNMTSTDSGTRIYPGEGVSGKVFETRQALRVNRYEEVASSQVRYLGEDAVIGVPILWRERLLGVISIASTPPRQFDSQDQLSLELFSRHAAIAIHNAQLFEREKRRVARMEAISSIGQIITSRLSLDEVLSSTVKALDVFLDYSHIDLFVLAKESDMLELKVQSSVYAENVKANYKQSIHQGIIGAAFHSSTPLLIKDVSKDDRYIPIPGVENVCSELAIAIRMNEQTLGVLNIESETVFGSDDIEGLSIVANQLAAAIENAQRFEDEKRRTMRVTTVSKVGQLMTSSLSLADILQTAVESINSSLSFNSTGIFLLEPGTSSRLVLQARSGPGNTVQIGKYSQALGEGNVGLAALKRESVFVVDVKEDKHYSTFPDAERIKSKLAIPIIVSNVLLGVLNIESEEVLSQEDCEGLETVADQLGVAIDNSRLFAETEVALSEMQLLYESSQRISMAMDVDGVVAAYLSQVAARRRYRCSIAYFEFDDEDNKSEIVLLGRWTADKGVMLERLRVPYFSDYFDHLLDAGQTVTMTNVTTDPHASETLKEAQIRGGYPALALIPLIVRGRRMGVISLSYPETHDWSATDIRPYQVTAAQLATAINSRLQQQQLIEGEQQLAAFEERQRLARELHDSVTQVIFSMTLIAQTIGSVMQRDPKEGEARVKKLIDLSQKARAEMRALLAELRPSSHEASMTMLPDQLRVREYGLVRALDSFLSEQNDTEVMVELSVDRYKRRTLKVEQAFYRIIQEALTNIKKHAEANLVTIDLWVDDFNSYLMIKDNGKGFNTEGIQESAGKHLGLNTMRERTETLKGTFAIDSQMGKGTIISIAVPQQ